MVAGVIGAVALTIMGNLEGFFELLAGHGFGDQGFWAALGIKNLSASGAGFPPTDGGWWFHAARQSHGRCATRLRFTQ